MHLSQLLACALLLTLLSLRPSEAKPGAPAKVPRTTPGEELAESQAAGGGLRRSDKTTGGGGANRSRLQDLRADTRSRTVLVRLLSESSNGRKQKGGKKKILSRGCFGLKLDRIGSMSGLGC
ncbi:C-type natriuretic peptide [Hyaena hyaena]|nr:C-type natriuretic peptide [Hyaena hyaena]